MRSIIDGYNLLALSSLELEGKLLCKVNILEIHPFFGKVSGKDVSPDLGFVGSVVMDLPFGFGRIFGLVRLFLHMRSLNFLILPLISII